MIVAEQMDDAEAVSLSIIIVSYNTKALTLECLRSVMAEAQSDDFEIVVVDNASNDGSADAIAALDIPITFIRLNNNIGFGPANNLASKRAVGKRLLLLNPDTIVRSHAIDRLRQFSDANRGTGIWGGRTLFKTGHLNPSSCWHRMTVWNLFCLATGLSRIFSRSAIFNTEAYGGWDRLGVREVDIVSGCFLMIDRSLWTRLGGFDKRYFMYGEDADLCLRARRSGARPMVTPNAVIVHHGGASERTRSDKMVRLLSAKMMLIRGHWPLLLRPIGIALLACWPLGRCITGKLVTLVVSSPKIGPRAQAWSEILGRWRDWFAGYPANVTTPAKQQDNLATTLIN